MTFYLRILHIRFLADIFPLHLNMFARILGYSIANVAKQKMFSKCLSSKSDTSHSALVTNTRITNTDNIISEQRNESIGCHNEQVNKYSFKMSSSISGEDLVQFNQAYSDIVDDLTNSSIYSNISFMPKWYRNMLEYNLPTGKTRPGLSTVLTYKLLEDPQKLTAEKLRLANIMGWCMEMLTMFFQMYDDVKDRSAIRRDAPCRYRVKDVGLTLNDAIILENSAYMILAKYLQHHPCYTSIVELFHNVTMKSCIGQAMDYRSCSAMKPTLEHISMDRHRAMALYKTGYISFQLPVVMAMYLAGIQDAKLHQQAESVLKELGHWMQVKNDFLNCFANVNTDGATLYGDIREGKCTWPAVVTLQRATPAQRTVMEQCYGHPDQQSVQAVLDVYKDLDMCTLYANYEEDTLNNIHNQIDQLDSRLPKKIFYNFMEIFKS